jgi:diadenosine tetraphosphate (Ap4A) HIT family hydrolase
MIHDATDPTNLVLLCGFHHHLLHQAHWHLAPDRDGGWTATSPDGHRQHHRRRRTSA